MNVLTFYLIENKFNSGFSGFKPCLEPKRKCPFKNRLQCMASLNIKNNSLEVL